MSTKRTCKSLLDRWKSRFSRPNGERKSQFYLAASGTAIQARLSLDEVTFEDMIDVVIAGSFEIKKRRKNKMIHGLSYRYAEGHPYKWTHVKVEDKYGPFERV